MMDTSATTVAPLTAEARLRMSLLLPGSQVHMSRELAVQLLAEIAGERAVARISSAEVQAEVGPKLVADLQAKATLALNEINGAKAQADEALRLARVALGKAIVAMPLAFAVGVILASAWERIG